MHIEVRGTGPALVLLHGWAMHGGLFAPLVERLQSKYTLHVVDLPGHGHSAASSLPLELDAVVGEIVGRVPRALWLGWSMGGLFALHAAHRAAAAVRGLLMVCASPRFVRAADWPLGMEPGVFRGFARDLAGDYRATIDRFLWLEAQGSEHARTQLQLLRAQAFLHGEPSPQRLREGLELLQQADLRDYLPGLRLPSLWLAGRRDRLVSSAAMEWAAQQSPVAVYQRIEHAGHAPFLSHADEVAAAISGFGAAVPA